MSEAGHVFTSDCEFPRDGLSSEPCCVGQQREDEGARNSPSSGFSWRGYFLRFTRTMRPAPRQLTRLACFPYVLCFDFTCQHSPRRMQERERERERERDGTFTDALMNACIFNALLKGCFRMLPAVPCGNR